MLTTTKNLLYFYKCLMALWQGLKIINFNGKFYRYIYVTLVDAFSVDEELRKGVKSITTVKVAYEPKTRLC